MVAFPTGLDVLTNPTAGDTLGTTAVLHSTQHATVNDAIEAIEAKVGVDGSANVASLDYLAKVALPKGMPAGGYAQATSIQSNITAAIDLTSLTVTFTALANRRYRIIGHVRLQSSVDGDYGVIQIATGAGVEVSSAQMKMGTSTQTMTPIAIVTPATGPVTYKLRAYRSLGTGTLQTNHTATNPAFILVEDIGRV